MSDGNRLHQDPTVSDIEEAAEPSEREALGEPRLLFDDPHRGQAAGWRR